MTFSGASTRRPFAGGAALALVAACAIAPLMAGCRGDRSDNTPRQFFPGLDDQPKSKTQTANAFFDDGATVRMPVAGTVAYGRTVHADAVGRDAFLRESEAIFRGIGADGLDVQRMPIAELLRPGETMQDFIALGREKYDIFCIACHGGSGAGDGMVGVRWANPLPSFHAEQYQPGGDLGQDGHLMHTILNGVPNVAGQLPALRMPAYAEQISVREAWAITAYIRVLQTSRKGAIDMVPEAQRQELRRTRGTSAGAGDNSATIGAAAHSQEDAS